MQVCTALDIDLGADEARPVSGTLQEVLEPARLRHHAVPEDGDYRAARGLDRRLFDRLLKGDWIAAPE
ncbi:MAG: hypothetical protein E5W15_30795, partial [Mesorhizobium sp.]